MIRYSFIGATGYAGVELIRLLLELLRLMINHPETELAHVADTFAVGTKIQDSHPALVGFYDSEIMDLNDPKTLDAIIEETLSAVTSERTSRVIDKDGGEASMEKRKREGYF